jgi:CheY-like chemotaxis protein
MMPAMTGVEFVERMKRLRPGSRVLLVSGYTGDALARRGLDEPKLPLLSKPFTSHELLREVRGTLDAPS